MSMIDGEVEEGDRRSWRCFAVHRRIRPRGMARGDLVLTTFTVSSAHRPRRRLDLMAIRRMLDAARRVEFRREPQRFRCIRVDENHADLFAELVDEREAGLRFRYGAGELRSRLRHPGAADSPICDIDPFSLRIYALGTTRRRDRVDEEDDKRPLRADEDLDDFQRLLAFRDARREGCRCRRELLA